MRLKRFFVLENYVSRYVAYKKNIKIIQLKKKIFNPCKLDYFWNINLEKQLDINFSHEQSCNIFGQKINLMEIDWHKDYISGFTYPLIRSDKIKLEKWYDKGIDIKFPWEVSRFYFAVNVGQKYLISKDESYYFVFRNLVLDWLEKNPFLVGVNWISTMEVAIRAINWIVPLNLFSEIFDKDQEFKDKVTVSLTQHAEYIISFPEVYKNGLTTNHTTAGFAGLLFLGLTLKDNPNSSKWVESAIQGLEKCMKDQVYEDGGDFEGSIPYHRLVLEMFAFAAIAAKVNNINFTGEFYKKLFKMFEFTAAYIDAGGNAPQVGDNDSGRCLILNALKHNDPYIDEHKHSYLLDLGESIFNYKFTMQNEKRNCGISNFLPRMEKIVTDIYEITSRLANHSSKFDRSGMHFLKNDNFSLSFFCCPLGQNGIGGHNHFDFGSFNLSIGQQQVIVDPGTFSYTTEKSTRDKFREYSYHNTLYTDLDQKIDWSQIGHWQLKDDYECEKVNFSENEISASIKYKGDKFERHRKIILSSETLEITDTYPGAFFSRINFAPNLSLQENVNSNYDFGAFIMVIENAQSVNFSNYKYSPNYGSVVNATCLIISAANTVKIIIQRKIC